MNIWSWLPVRATSFRKLKAVWRTLSEPQDAAIARANRTGPGLGARPDAPILAISVTALIPLSSDAVMHRLTAAAFSRVSLRSEA